MFPDQLHVGGQLNIEIMSHVSSIVSHKMKGEDKLCRGIGQSPNSGSKENSHKKAGGLISSVKTYTESIAYLYLGVRQPLYIMLQSSVCTSPYI